MVGKAGKKETGAATHVDNRSRRPPVADGISQTTKEGALLGIEILEVRATIDCLTRDNERRAASKFSLEAHRSTSARSLLDNSASCRDLPSAAILEVDL